MRASLLALALVGWTPCVHAAGVVSWMQNLLWQEHYYWDALINSRSRAARSQADPNLLPVLRVIAQQTAQQAANLMQINNYAKAQQDNLRFAFAQKDPTASLATIKNNLDTLSKGSQQISNNLFFLTARCRMASTQALPDPDLMATAAALIQQIQASQLQLNALYASAVAVKGQVNEQTWLKDKTLQYNAEHLVKASLSVQDSLFEVYNAAYELYVRSK